MSIYLISLGQIVLALGNPWDHALTTPNCDSVYIFSLTYTLCKLNYTKIKTLLFYTKTKVNLAVKSFFVSKIQMKHSCLEKYLHFVFLNICCQLLLSEVSFFDKSLVQVKFKRALFIIKFLRFSIETLPLDLQSIVRIL